MQPILFCASNWGALVLKRTLRRSPSPESSPRGGEGTRPLDVFGIAKVSSVGEDSGEGDRQTDQIPNRTNAHLRSIAESVALSFLWVPAFAGMTARFAKVSRSGEDSGPYGRVVIA